MRSPPPWLADLTLQSLVARHGPAAVDAALGHGFVYTYGPALRADGAVAASFRDGRGDDTATVDLHVAEVAPFASRLLRQCSCGAMDFCPHVLALLTDMALAPGLRDVIARGAAPESLLVTLPGLRAAGHRAFIAEQLCLRWLPVRPVTSLPAPEYSLALPALGQAGASLQGLALGADGSAGFDLRLRLPGSRALVDPAEVPAAAFPPADRRILRLCAPAAGRRKGWRVAGGDASVVVHLLAAHERAACVEATGEPVVFATELVAPAVVPARLPRDLVTLSRETLLTEIRPLYGARAGRWEDAPPGASEPVAALEGRWRTADGGTDVAARDAVLFRGPYPYLWVPATRTMHPVDPAVDLDAAWHLQVAPAVELAEGSGPLLYDLLRRSLRGRGVALPPAEAMGVAVDRPTFALRLGGRALAVEARLEARYRRGHLPVDPTAPAPEDGARDAESEALAVARVLSAGLRWDPLRGAFTALDDAAAWFWTHGVAALRAAGAPAVDLLIPRSLAGARVRGPLRPRLGVSLVKGMLQADLVLAVESESAPADLAAVRAALARKGRWVVLGDGALAEITAEVAELLRDADEFTVEGAAARAVVPLHQIGRVERWAAYAEAVGEAAFDGAAAGLRERLRTLAVSPEPAVPVGLVAVLRPYQRAGLAWLQFLDALGAGGILADDMGLGKTVTTLALIQWRRERDGASPTLVVCPTSVVGNWLREAARFTPGLRLVSLHGGHGGGAARAREWAWASGGAAGADLVVTSYALLRRDVEGLSSVPFRYVVLDEAQGVKNADAETARAARRLRAGARLALTGTPVENRLGEIWSLMDWCNPGVLGSRRAFETRYENPLAQGPDPALTARLWATVRPFVLRRTKRGVLDDLPPKEEIDVACPLDPAHRRRYDALAAVLRRQVRAARKGDATYPGAYPGAPGAIAVLTALLRLRQVACDPRLVDPSAEAPEGKRGAFLARVRALVAEGRRALVFSQFVELLTLWRRDLDAEGIGYAYLDGATVDRDAVVAGFQRGTAPLFLISLKAGGTGLNLTAADTVILCDPWWNPAVEDQAADRAHRIGQSRAVTVYRLVAAGTVEERVMALKARKRALAEAVLGEDADALRGITAEDLDILLGAADDTDEAMEPSGRRSLPSATPSR